MQTRRAFLNAASILLVSGRAIADVPTPKNEVPKLDCELIVEKNTGREDSGFGGVLILKNTTKAPYKIAYMDDPTEHLALEVRDSRDKLLPVGAPRYGAVYAKLHAEDDKPRELVIKPGETYRQHLALMGQVNRSRVKMTPGRYTVQAVFENDNQEFRSKKHTLTVVAE